LQGIKVYGAEIKVGGFSGYLCELLVIHHGSFVGTLEAFAKCAARMVIDIENYYAGREKELRLLFDEPLVVIDPVDKGRNVASAVKLQKIYTMIGAARAFLKTPSERFFFPPKTKALPIKGLQNKLKQCGSDFLFLTFRNVNVVPDILWGQLYKTQRSLRKLLELNDFKVLRDVVWSDEKTLSAFIFELEQRTIPSVRKHLGPPLEREEECDNFLSKYVSNGSVVSGPFIEDGRWVAEVQRKHTDAVAFLREKLKEGGRNTGVANLISEAFKDWFKLMVNDEVSIVYSDNKTFAEFLTEFLDGKPFWLKPEEA
jgi:tRNA nucleotidyltransferase (CCA-adding enzyme)